MSRTSPKKVAEKLASERFDDYQAQDVFSASRLAVRQKARVTEVTRKSPDKVYKHVKSKIAGNMRSIKKSQTRKVV